MCTIIVFRGVAPSAPLVIAANRDEFYARKAAAPAVVSSAPRVAAPLDLEKRGTWMGVTAHGFFVGLTNQRPTEPPDPSLRSRGEVAMQALMLGELSKVHALLAGLDGGSYNPFNLLFGDATALEVAYVRRATPVAFEEVPEGIHVLPNDLLDSPAFPKVVRARALAHAELATVVDSERGAPWLGDHVLVPEHAVPEAPSALRLPPGFARALQAICVHTEHYGTRSSTLAVLDPGRVRRYMFADGPPCVTPFHDYTALVEGS